jgi:exopolyphosphatase/guanosine-5'-triphosphate,3'-diphosphate pyrophosphatase
MRLATIDVGTNTVLLLISDIGCNGKITTVRQEQRIPRLGKGVAREKRISEEAFDRLKPVLQEYLGISRELLAERVVACGTSFLRDATNREDFVDHVEKETGVVIEILTGDQEAVWSYRGALSGMAGLGEKISLIDVGGGSTEIIVGTKETVEFKLSLDVGSVRITENYFRHMPPLPQEFEDASLFIRNEVSSLGAIDMIDSTLIGVAGTATTLAAISQNLTSFDADKISGYVLSVTEVGILLQNLCRMTVGDIRKIPAMPPGREDVITAGALILDEFLKFSGLGSVIVSDRGLRYGTALREWERTKA